MKKRQGRKFGSIEVFIIQWAEGKAISLLMEGKGKNVPEEGSPPVRKTRLTHTIGIQIKALDDLPMNSKEGETFHIPKFFNDPLDRLIEVPKLRKDHYSITTVTVQLKPFDQIVREIFEMTTVKIYAGFVQDN